MSELRDEAKRLAAMIVNLYRRAHQLGDKVLVAQLRPWDRQAHELFADIELQGLSSLPELEARATATDDASLLPWRVAHGNRRSWC